MGEVHKKIHGPTSVLFMSQNARIHKSTCSWAVPKASYGASVLEDVGSLLALAWHGVRGTEVRQSQGGPRGC